MDDLLQGLHRRPSAEEDFSVFPQPPPSPCTHPFESVLFPATDSTIATTLNLAVTHLDTYTRMLFLDLGSAVKTIIPQHLIGKLSLLGLDTIL